MLLGKGTDKASRSISTTLCTLGAALIFSDFQLMHGAPLRMPQCQMGNLVVERHFTASLGAPQISALQQVEDPWPLPDHYSPPG